MIRSLFAALAARMAAERDTLCALDGVIGDADHGIAMEQGMAAASAAVSATNGTLQDLFNAAAITARFPPMSRGRVAIVTNGGGAGVLAVDQLIDEGCELAALGDDTLAALGRVLPPTWSHANPVDIIGDAPPERYRAAVETVAADAGVDAILVMNCPTALALPSPAATAVAATAAKCEYISMTNNRPSNLPSSSHR